MQRIIRLVIVLLVIIFGASFALLNADPVAFNYYFSAVQIPLSLIVVLALFFGAALGMLASAGMMLSSRRELTKLRKEAKLAQQEVKNLRSLPIEGKH